MPTVHSERIRSGDPESSPAPVAAPVWRDSTAIDDATEASLRVRRFHLGHPSATSPPEELPLGLLPALLHRYRATPVRGDYPLFVAPGGEAREDPVCLSPREFLEKAARAGLDDSARTLKENLVRLERILRTVMGAQAGAAAAPEVMAESGRRLVSELSLAATETAELENQLRALSAALPENGIFLAYEPGVTMRLFALAARTRLHPRRRSFRLEVSRLLQEARGRLAADLGKVAGSDPARLGSSMGASATDLLDPAALSELLGPHRGTTVWGSERRARVERACQTLETFLTAPAGPLLIWISSGPPAASLDDVLPIVADDPCGAALHRFESEASELAQIFRATRLLTLELADRYDEQRHDPSLASFDWEAFTRE